jgi:hypothetical protein
MINGPLIIADLPQQYHELLPDFGKVPTNGPFRYSIGQPAVYLYEDRVAESPILGRMCAEYRDVLCQRAEDHEPGIWYLTHDGFISQDRVFLTRADLADALKKRWL